MYSQNEALRNRVCPGVLRGEKRIALAVSEATGGSDVANLRTSAVLSEDGSHYVLNGLSLWVWAASMCVCAWLPVLGGLSLERERARNDEVRACVGGWLC